MRRGSAGVQPAWILQVVPSSASSGESERHVPKEPPEVRVSSAPADAAAMPSAVGGAIVGEGVAPLDVGPRIGDFTGEFAGKGCAVTAAEG